MPEPQLRIHGSGPVALAFGLMLARAGIDPIRIDAGERVPRGAGETGKPADGGPRRHLALSEGSCQLLRRICKLPAGGRIESIDIALAGRAGRTTIRAADFGIESLGLVVSWTDLVESLRASANATLSTTTAVRHQETGEGLQDAGAGNRIEVHAEGAPRDDEVDALDFGQGALLTEVQTAPLMSGRPSVAYERFDRHGPLAMLPIGPARDRYSVVWCDEIASCRRRATLGAEALTAELQRQFGEALGPVAIDAPVDVVALQRRRRRVLARGNEVWIGNAAQTLHPVAGQGLNLGLRDAFELARLLGDEAARARENRRASNTEQLLQTFVHARSRDRSTIVTLTDGLARVFGVTGLHGIESALLSALELSPALRRPLARTLLYGLRR